MRRFLNRIFYSSSGNQCRVFPQTQERCVSPIFMVARNFEDMSRAVSPHFRFSFFSFNNFIWLIRLAESSFRQSPFFKRPETGSAFRRNFRIPEGVPNFSASRVVGIRLVPAALLSSAQSTAADSPTPIAEPAPGGRAAASS